MCWPDLTDEEVNVTPLQRQSHIRVCVCVCVCAIFILSVWVLLHVFGGHIPRLGVGILSSTVSHTELTGGPLFGLQATGEPDSAQRPLRDLLHSSARRVHPHLTFRAAHAVQGSLCSESALFIKDLIYWQQTSFGFFIKRQNPSNRCILLALISRCCLHSWVSHLDMHENEIKLKNV